ncbi:MAG: type I-B CRISPR-associated protein Cas7/Cst2/DevR, partial [Leptospiraceae bacterium]|nr:type I-B CRISPR-associated protein Cas7/Cst2/DevR [Leptospiraceae bacterium]
YAVEMHATRFQYSFALSGDDVKNDWKGITLLGLANLRRVAGNHARFLFDFAPAAIVLRITHDPAPRILYCFDESEEGIRMNQLVQKVTAGDVDAGELIIGGEVSSISEVAELKDKGATVFDGIKPAIAEAINRIGK